ncbi:E3 ubiquitin-protein ligase TRIM47 [Synchiropus picturatus]
MAMAGENEEELKKELTCAICLDYYKCPVILKCGHNFCQACITTHWDENGESYGYQCPQCRTVFPKRIFTKNYLVQSLVAKLDDLNFLAPAECSPAEDKAVCREHGKELKFFCQVDQRPVCVVCRESKSHRFHGVAPLAEAVEDMKMTLQMQLRDLNYKKHLYQKVKGAEERTKSNLRLRKQRLKEKIEADVGSLVRFLLDERDSILDSLDAEEVSVMAVVNDNLTAVEEASASVQKTMEGIYSHLGADVRTESLAKLSDDLLSRSRFPTLEPTNCQTEFTDFTGPFQLIIWKKMMHLLHTMPQNLTLDPDTAHPNLLISDFDTKVEEGCVRSNEPDLPSRFTRFYGVLATAQYSSGQHYWEVDVKDKGVWYLGVTNECSNRKGFISLTPSAGYWSICLQDRLYANGEHGRFTIADYWNSPRVGVYLDYDRGRVSFYDAVTMKRVFMFETHFTEPVTPFFSPGKNDPYSRIQICHYY